MSTRPRRTAGKTQPAVDSACDTPQPSCPDCVRREQGLVPEAEEGPQPCHWYDDGRGGRFLVPGCMSRVINPDVDQCSCRTIEEQLSRAREENARLQRLLRGLQEWHDQVTRAVYDHPDGIKIMKLAADRSMPPAGAGRQARRSP